MSQFMSSISIRDKLRQSYLSNCLKLLHIPNIYMNATPIWQLMPNQKKRKFEILVDKKRKFRTYIPPLSHGIEFDYRKLFLEQKIWKMSYSSGISRNLKPEIVSKNRHSLHQINDWKTNGKPQHVGVEEAFQIAGLMHNANPIPFKFTIQEYWIFE